jgi:hypothetical protein
MAEIKQLEIKHNHSQLDEKIEEKIRGLCMKKGMTFIEARDKVLSRYKRFNS